MGETTTPGGPAAAGDLPARPAEVPPFRFGAFEVHPSLHRVTDGARHTTLEPRVMHVLVCLASRPGAVVTRRDLLDTVWSDAVVGEEVLTRAVSLLRQAFDDSPRSPGYLETIRGGGYRAVAEVRPLSPAPSGRGARGPRRRWAAVAVAAVAVAAAVVAWRQLGRTPEAIVLDTSPLTALPGRELHPRWDPAGGMVAYAYHRDGIGGIAVTRPGAARPLVLTEGEHLDLYPAWSPDGAAVAFVRIDDDGPSVQVAPLVGGPPRQVARPAHRPYGLDWSVDGEVLVYAAADDDGSARLVAVAAADGAERWRTRPDAATHTGDSQPRFSPDGGRIAFVRCDHFGLQEVWTAGADGSAARRLSHGMRSIQGLDWTPDGAALVVAAAPGSRMRLWRISARGGDRRPLPVAAEDARWPSVSASGAVTFVARSMDTNIWRLGPGETPPQVVLASTRADHHPSFSPQGERVAFVSDRTGAPELWVAESGGHGLVRLTDFGGDDVGRPRWSPDGRRLAVSVTDEAGTSIRLVGLADHAVTTLERRHPHEVVLGWTPDGGRLVAEVDTPDGWRVRTLPVGPTGAGPVALGPRGATRLVVAGDRLLTGAPGEAVRAWPLDGGPPREVADPALAARWRGWWPAGAALLALAAPGGELVRYEPGSGGEVATGIRVPRDAIELEASADGRDVLVVRVDRIDEDLVLLPDGLS